MATLSKKFFVDTTSTTVENLKSAVLINEPAPSIYTIDKHVLLQ